RSPRPRPAPPAGAAPTPRCPRRPAGARAPAGPGRGTAPAPRRCPGSPATRRSTRPPSSDGHQDLAVLDLHLVRLDRPDRGERERAAVAHVELRAVPRAHDRVTLQLPGREREVLVRAVV